MASINDLPAELILAIAHHSVTSQVAPWLDVAALAHTNSKHYSVLNGLVYQLGAQFYFPVFWAAQNGRADVLHKLLQAGLGAVRQQEWEIRYTHFPSIFRVATWAGQFQSVNTLAGAFEDGIQSKQARFASRLRISIPHVDGDACYFSDDGSLRNPNDKTLSFLDKCHQRTTEPYQPLDDPDTATVMYSPLHAAAANGHIEIIKILLDQDEDGSLLNAPSRAYCWCRPLPTLSAMEGLQTLETQGAALASEHERRSPPPEWTALHHAIVGFALLCHGQIEAAMYLLERGASYFVWKRQSLPWVHGSQEGGVTVLHLAAGAGYLELVKFIVEGGYQTNLDIVDRFGQTPLHWAFRNGHYDTTVPWLIAHGADTDTVIGYSRTPLLVELIEHDQYKEAAKLVNLGANANLSWRGQSPLHLASEIYVAEKDNPTVQLDMRCLIESLVTGGANILATTPPGTGGHNPEPIENACHSHNVEAVELLLAARAKLSRPDQFDCVEDCVDGCVSGFTYKNSNAGVKILKLLVDYAGSHLEPSRISPSSVMHSVLSEFQYKDKSTTTSHLRRLRDAVRMLLCRGADPGFANESAETCFELALRGGEFRMCDRMLRQGFKPTSADVMKFWQFGLTESSATVLDYVLHLNKQSDTSQQLRVNAADLGKLLELEKKWDTPSLEDLLLGHNLLNIQNQNTSDLDVALLKACRAESLGIAQMLIEAGADVNTVTESEYGDVINPLLVVMQSRAEQKYERRTRPNLLRLLEVLLQHGADILQPGEMSSHIPYGRPIVLDCDEEEFTRSPLSYAILIHDIEALRLMFQYNPQILMKDPRAISAPYLHLFILNITLEDSDQTVAELVQQGADPRVLDKSSSTALCKLLACVVPEREKFQPSWVQSYPRMMRMMWHDDLDINKTNDKGVSVGQLLNQLLDWRTKQIESPTLVQQLYKNLAVGIDRHFELTVLGGKQYAVQLRPFRKGVGVRVESGSRHQSKELHRTGLS